MNEIRPKSICSRKSSALEFHEQTNDSTVVLLFSLTPISLCRGHLTIPVSDIENVDRQVWTEQAFAMTVPERLREQTGPWEFVTNLINTNTSKTFSPPHRLDSDDHRAVICHQVTVDLCIGFGEAFPVRDVWFPLNTPGLSATFLDTVPCFPSRMTIVFARF